MIYIVSGFLYRNTKYKDSELIHINKEFKDKNPKKARKKAHSYFRSVLDVLLESLKIDYKNDKQAEKELHAFYTSNIISTHAKLPFVRFNEDHDKILTISFCEDESQLYVTKTGIKIYDDEKVIKAIGYESFLLQKRIFKNLQIEKEFYSQINEEIV